MYESGQDKILAVTRREREEKEARVYEYGWSYNRMHSIGSIGVMVAKEWMSISTESYLPVRMTRRDCNYITVTAEQARPGTCDVRRVQVQPGKIHV